MRSTLFFALLITVLGIASCQSSTQPPVLPLNNTTPDETATPLTLESTQSTSELNEFRSSNELNKELLQEVSFFAGGAGCGLQNIGVSGNVCQSVKEGSIVLNIAGVFRVPDQGRPEQYPWWGNVTDSCYETLQFGDMVYFTAQGFSDGEQVHFTIQGPNGVETYVSEVQNNVQYHENRGNCSLDAAPAAARISWIVNPKLGVGTYKVTVKGEISEASLGFPVVESPTPNFGVSVGDSSLPLVLSPEREIKLIYSGFQPNTIVTTLLYYQNIEEKSEELVRYIDFQMDETGSAVNTVPWDSSLPPGKYWFLVPAILPKISAVSDFGVDPALWAVYFYADTPPIYDPAKLFSSAQNILLRPSCGVKLTANKDNAINLRYGIWGVNGHNLLEETKDKIITRLFINGDEVVGYRSNKVIPMSEMQCGNSLENGYFLYNETQIGPYQNISELNVKVEYSFNDTITDGYDLLPKDGMMDFYTPKTSFTQTYTIKIVP